MKYVLDKNRYRNLARAVAAEGCVLLCNENKTLPLRSGTRVAVFGRAQAAYYKSGTGSGGMVNTMPVTSILRVLENEPDLILDADVRVAYETWIEMHPFEQGNGWATEPWFQKEMPLKPALAKAAAQRCDCAIVVIGRTAGEDQDNCADEGSYYLTQTEKEMLETVCAVFSHTIVLLNVGNILDMQWVEQMNPGAVIYLWQGGEMGAYAAVDILMGRVNPCGKLSDTIARRIEDYPAYADYGNPVRTEYREDIYVGYRYFETFAPEKVLYPFGFGMSYTQFSIKPQNFEVLEETVSIHASVTNVGSVAGKEVVQVYCSAPQGKLGKPVRTLCSFAKTDLLEPGQQQELEITFSRYTFASYDDSGASGAVNAYVLEAGTYQFYLGADVRAALPAGEMQLDSCIVLQSLSEALAPVRPFNRIHPVKNESGFCVSYVPTPIRKINLSARIAENLPHEIYYTGMRGLLLKDVANGHAQMNDFIAQLDREALCCLVRGEGMCSPKVTPGTAGAFGGVTEELKALGIPIACCADGPGGIRMDCGTLAMSLPNGTCIACTFNEVLTQELFSCLGLELRKNQIDTILGPGMNLHRHVLNGRNFEYFSEDPIVTGKMASAELHGLHKSGVTGTIKHFACNNQEYHRNDVDAVVSQRALRELYLKGFEIAVREGGAYCIMSSYNLLNGVHTPSNYDLLTTILRGEWGYDGLVMTDWWAKGNFEGEPDAITCMASQIRAQNDLYMVTRDAKSNTNGDDSATMLDAGRVTLAEYQRSAANICRNLIKMPSFAHFYGKTDEVDEAIAQAEPEEGTYGRNVISVDASCGEAMLSKEGMQTGNVGDFLFEIRTGIPGNWTFSMCIRPMANSALAQSAVSVFCNRDLIQTISLSGTEQNWMNVEFPLGAVIHPGFYIRLHKTSGMEIGTAYVRRTQLVSKQ